VGGSVMVALQIKNIPTGAGDDIKMDASWAKGDMKNIIGRDGNYIQCAYSSLAQCNMSASGRAAQCLTNPYFAYGSKVPPGRIYRRHYRVY